MSRYDSVFAALAERAVLQGGIDVETFLRQHLDAGIPEDVIIQRLEDDLVNEGPIFGRFLRSLTGAATSSVLTATRQGELVGALDASDELNKLVSLASGEGSALDAMVQQALETGDPEAAGLVEVMAAEVVEETWVAELINTCHLCLPLHGKTRTRDEWTQLGLLPELIHQQAGWESSCHCRLVPRVVAGERAELLAPLARERVGGKGSKRTMRSVTQRSLDAAIAARDIAVSSPEGRATLRRLGEVNDTE